MKSILFILFLIAFFSTAQAQGLYRGGAGGGWVSARYQNGAVKTLNYKIVSSSGIFLNNIELPASNSMKMRVYDCLGRKMEESQMNQNATKISLVNTYARGIYIVAIEIGDKIWTKKIIL